MIWNKSMFFKVNVNSDFPFHKTRFQAADIAPTPASVDEVTTLRSQSFPDQTSPTTNTKKTVTGEISQKNIN
jgi:hypothetical protein